LQARARAFEQAETVKDSQRSGVEKMGESMKTGGFYKIERWCARNGCFKAEKRLYSTEPVVSGDGKWRVIFWDGEKFVTKKENK